MGFFKHLMSYFIKPKQEAVVRDTTGVDLGLSNIKPSKMYVSAPDYPKSKIAIDLPPTLPVVALDAEGNEVVIEPISQDTMSRYLNVMQSPLLKQERHFEISCPYCELNGVGDEFVYRASDLADLINHCTDHQVTAIEAKMATFMLQYLALKKVL